MPATGITDNNYELVVWGEDDSVADVFNRVQKLRCVRFISWEVSSSSREFFRVETEGGKNEFTFGKGDTLVFTDNYVFHFPAQKFVHKGSEAFIARLRAEGPELF